MGALKVPTSVTATIAAGQSLSNAVDLTAGSIAMMIMPANWETTVVSFQLSEDNVNFYDVYQDGKEVTRAVVAGAASIVPTSLTQAALWMKIRSGQTGHPLVQSAARSFTCVLI
jgi:hypothetical protein